MSERALSGDESSIETKHILKVDDDHEKAVYSIEIKEEIGNSDDNRPSDDWGLQNDEPPSKKRKIIAETSKPSPRAHSPPWKKVTADGPTTFLENGRRRSGRTNMVPLEQQPQLRKRQTRAAYDKLLDKRNRPSYSLSTRPKIEPSTTQSSPLADATPRRGPGRPPKVKIEHDFKKSSGLSSPSSTRRAAFGHVEPKSPVILRRSTLRSTHHESSPIKSKQRSPSPPLILQKVTFRVALPKPSISTPANVPPPKKYNSFREFLDEDLGEPYRGQDTLSAQEIKKEANARRRVHEAQRSGQILRCGNSKLLPDRQTDVPRPYSHWDHLLGHVVHFRHLLRQETREHRKKAEQLAYEAKKYVEEKERRGRVKTTEELVLEEMEKARARYRGAVKDLDRLWFAVQAEVNLTRQRQFEEEQQAKLKNHLNRVLERTDEMLTRREGSELTSEIDSNESEDAVSTDDDNMSDSDVLSTSSSKVDATAEQDDPDEQLTAEQLKAKYEGLPDVERAEGLDFEQVRSQVSGSEDEDTDPDIEMDSEFESDVGSSKETDEEDDESDESNLEADEGDLLSMLFSKKEVAALKVQSSDFDEHSNTTPTEPKQELDAQLEINSSLSDIKSQNQVMELPTDISNPQGDQTNLDSSGTEVAHHLLQNQIENVTEELTSQDVSLGTSPGTSATKQSEPESLSSIEVQPEMVNHVHDQAGEKSDVKTRVPPLLRGTLREYQHEGLDWLANLYANGRSGILADEMGLGKTIQSIALLAHLATEYEIWGPHLIVVPTSVMLNWEMEFKKFLPGFKILTYYGNLEERKQKRRGWMADDSFNVCITSYQLVLQDANSFKRRKWHYMILDEAHNIKNFRSERWQTMMTFNTRARLLLTGTPLQNNLTELWSLLFFLHYGQEGQDDDEAFAGLKEWSEWFKRPVESILEHGRQVLDQEDREQVAKLHKVIRPFLLRRLKADVEKQMPAKYEHVEMCRLSKRQRQLYDGFMSRAQTKETLASGNYLSIINALMQLRKVCNHPDLFESRPINTSFAMQKSVAAQYEIQDLLARRKLLNSDPLDEIDLDFLQLVPVSNEKISLIENIETVRRHAYHPFKALRDSQSSKVKRHAIPIGQTRIDILTTLENIGRNARLQDIDRTMYYEAYRHHQRPIYGRTLLEKLNFSSTSIQHFRFPGQNPMSRYWEFDAPLPLLEMVRSNSARAEQMQRTIEQYACVTPAVVATDLSKTFLTELGSNIVRDDMKLRPDPFHQSRMKLSIAFPDKRLLQFDCGKLQRLDRLLRNLQVGGHRALIFTQMTKVLDILEQFLNIHGHRYLRLDGATKIEQRQILTDRFNNDTRILCFILSSRSGGLGINLTGADTVIFYDLDWNPAMDRQCTDRAHRIGQTRDVHIYRFVSEHTIESNILRKASQKQLLDDVVIQEGDFTTDYMNKLTYHDMLDDQTENDMAGAAMDRVLGNEKSAAAALEQAEDQEDVSAAKVAAKEVQNVDDGDFEDKAVPSAGVGDQDISDKRAIGGITNAEADPEGIHHIDEYLTQLQLYLVKDVPLVSMKDKGRRGKKRATDLRRQRQR